MNNASPSAAAPAPLPVAVIYGSAREGRLADKVGGWVVEEMRRDASFTIDVIDPLTLGLPAHFAGEQDPAAAALRERLARADAFVIVTPEYNRSFPAALKAIVDAAHDEWEAKPVGFVSYGGMSGGIRAVEQLRQVFAGFNAVSVRDGVALTSAWERFGPDGALLAPERPRRTLHLMLAQLRWWGRALRRAREIEPLSALAA